MAAKYENVKYYEHVGVPLESLRPILVKLRVDTKKVLDEWEKLPFEAKQIICSPYLDFLRGTIKRHIHENEDAIIADQHHLEEFQTRLEEDISKAEIGYMRSQIEYICAIKKMTMIFEKLNGALEDDSTDEKSQVWILKMLEEEPWGEYQDIVNDCTVELREKASATNDVASLEQIKDLESMKSEEFHLEDKDGTTKKLKGYRKEADEACIRVQEYLDCVAGGPDMLDFVKSVLSKLIVRISEMNKEAGPDDVPPTMQASDGAELPVKGLSLSDGYNQQGCRPRGAGSGPHSWGGSGVPAAAHGSSNHYPQIPPPNDGVYPPQSGGWVQHRPSGPAQLHHFQSGSGYHYYGQGCHPSGAVSGPHSWGGYGVPAAAHGYSYDYPQMHPPQSGGWVQQRPSGPAQLHHSQNGSGYHYYGQRCRPRGAGSGPHSWGGSGVPATANGSSYDYPQMPPPNDGGYPPQSGGWAQQRPSGPAQPHHSQSGRDYHYYVQGGDALPYGPSHINYNINYNIYYIYYTYNLC